MFAVTIALSNTVQVNAQTATTITVNGADGTTTQNFTLTQLKALPSDTGYGGFYQPNQNQINNGNWTGVSLLTLCNQVGGLPSTFNVTVTGQGVNNFTYGMVANGANLNPTYMTYNNLTGAVQNQSLPVTIILAYQSNGTNIANNQVPRMVIIGTEGLLMDGSGGRSVTQISLIDTAPSPTSTPTASPTPAPTPTPTPTPTLTPTPSPTASPTPSPTPSLSPSPTPTIPEFPATATVIMILTATTMAIMVYKRKSFQQLTLV